MFKKVRNFCERNKPADLANELSESDLESFGEFALVLQRRLE